MVAHSHSVSSKNFLCTPACIFLCTAPKEARSHVKFVQSRREAASNYICYVMNLVQIFLSKYTHTYRDFFFSFNDQYKYFTWEVIPHVQNETVCPGI